MTSTGNIPVWMGKALTRPTHEVYRQSAATQGRKFSSHGGCDHWWRISDSEVIPTLHRATPVEINIFKTKESKTIQILEEDGVGTRRNWRKW